MNKQRRTALEKALGLIEEAKAIVSAVCTEEEEAYNNLPNGFQEGKQGDKLQATLNAVDEANEALQTAMDAIEEAVN